MTKKEMQEKILELQRKIQAIDNENKPSAVTKKQFVTFTAAIPYNDYEKIKSLAYANNTSISNYICSYIDKLLSDKKEFKRLILKSDKDYKPSKPLKNIAVALEIEKAHKLEALISDNNLTNYNAIQNLIMNILKENNIETNKEFNLKQILKNEIINSKNGIKVIVSQDAVMWNTYNIDIFVRWEVLAQLADIENKDIYQLSDTEKDTMDEKTSALLTDLLMYLQSVNNGQDVKPYKPNSYRVYLNKSLIMSLGRRTITAEQYNQISKKCSENNTDIEELIELYLLRKIENK